MDRILDLVAESTQLRQNVDAMASHVVRLMSEVATVGRESTSGSDVLPTKRDVIQKPPRRNRPRPRQDALRDGLEPRLSRRDKTAGNNNETFEDDDKENACGLNRCTGARSDCFASSLRSSFTPSSEFIYQKCLGSVIASYLSPLRGQMTSRHHAHRFFDTLTSPRDETLVAKPSSYDNKDDSNNNANTSVWSSDTTLPADAETTSSGVETATSSPPEVRPDASDVIKEQVAECSRSVALCDVSRISVVSSTSVPREQLSSLGATGGPSSAFHSTFNYPLHSTLRGASVRCPSPLPQSPTSPVCRRDHHIEDRRPVPPRHRDLPPPACRRCDDSTPLRRQHARVRLERQRPLVDRRRRSSGRPNDDEEKTGSGNMSLHATRGSLPDLSDLSTDSELYERVDRPSRRRRRRCVLNPAVVDLDMEPRVRRHHARRASCTHCHCQTRPYVRQSADPLMVFDRRRNDDHAWSRTPSSVGRPSCRRYNPAIPAQPSLHRQAGCLPSVRSHGETRRRPHRQGVDLGCGHKRLLSRKLKLFSNILCTARTADVTQLTTLGHV